MARPKIGGGSSDARPRGARGSGKSKTRPTHAANNPKPTYGNTDAQEMNAARTAASVGKAKERAISTSGMSASQLNAIAKDRQTKPKKTTPTITPDDIVDSGAAVGSVFDGIAEAVAKAAGGGSGKAAKVSGLDKYIAQALKDLGPGTDYSGLRKQLQTDTSTSDKKIGAMYDALTLGIRANDPILKGIYEDSAAQIKSSGASAQSTVTGAYDKAQNAIASRLAAVGASEYDNGVSEGYAAADEANAASTLARNTSSAEIANSEKGAAARTQNLQQSNAAGFQGDETRSGLQTQLAQQLAKIAVQQSTENASRREKALSLATQRQGNDQQAAAAAVSARAAAANTAFSQQLALAKAKLAESNSYADNSRADRALEANIASKSAAITDRRSAQASTNQARSDANALALKKLQLQQSGASKSRQMAAATSAYRKGDITLAQYQKNVRALG